MVHCLGESRQGLGLGRQSLFYKLVSCTTQQNLVKLKNYFSCQASQIFADARFNDAAPLMINQALSRKQATLSELCYVVYEIEKDGAEMLVRKIG